LELLQVASPAGVCAVPVVPRSSGADAYGAAAGYAARQPQETGPVAALRHVLRVLQERVDREYERLRRAGTCGEEFMRFLDELEELAKKEMSYRGFEPLGDRVYVPRREQGDLVLGYFRYGPAVVEIGLRGLNRCSVLEELTGGEPPRVYARIYTGGGASMVIEAGEERSRQQWQRTGYIM